MIGRIIFCPGPFVYPHLQDIHLWFQRRADSGGACSACPGLTIARWLSKHDEHPLIHVKYARMWSSGSQWEVASTLSFKCPERKWSPGMRSGNLCSHTIALLGNVFFIRFTKLAKSGKSSMAMYSVMHGHSWCKNGTNGKRMSCSILVCHMRIFKLINFRTMGPLKMDYLFFWYALYSVFFSTSVFPPIDLKIACKRDHICL